MKKAFFVLALFILAIIVEAQQTGSFIDNRDGRTYKTVKIGTQIWMAENLNFNTESDSWCYDNNKANCNIYGRLYTYDEALKSCPTGWHLPDDAEWKLLAENSGSQGAGIGGAAANLKATGYEAWNESSASPTSSNNVSGFTAMPGGCYVFLDNSFSFKGESGLWWSKTIYDDFNAKAVHMQYHDTSLYQSYFYSKKYGLSVRCVKD